VKNKLFTKYFLMAAVILIVFVVLGGIFTIFMSEQLHSHRNMIPPLFIAKLIDQLDSSDKLKAVKKFEEAQDNNMRSRIILYDQNGEVVYNKTNSQVEKLKFEFIQKFSKDYDFFNNPAERKENAEGERRGGPAFFMFLFGGGPPHPPGGDVIVRLSGEPIYYLGMGPPQGFKPEGLERYLPLLRLLSLFVSLLLGGAVTISLIYASVRKRVVEADSVLTQIQGGNLKARFMVNRKDEFGEAMLRFNRMADEIEALVDHLKDVESSRNKILQELAHDLRTPVASLKNLLETIETQNEKLQPELRKELALLSLREVDYFGQLVEDLLLLAQVDEPKYRVENNKVILNEVIEEVISDCLSRPLYKDKKITVKKNYELTSAEIFGSYSLLYRMFRNAFENSLSFAKSQIQVDVKKVGASDMQIQIIDDGPGLSDEQMIHFGERKLSRQMISGEKSGRLSIGLGSVIIKKICKIHRGEVQIANKKQEDGSGRIAGAVLTIDFHDVKMNS
jgi:signal transduction histidine kinase